MKKLTFLILLVVLLALPGLTRQDDSDRELARTQEYIGATVKQGVAKVSALKAYIQKFPDTKQRWTKLAHYSLAVEYFQLKKYADTVKYAKKTLDMGSPGDGEKGRLLLIIGNSYGVKSASIYNNESALKYTKQAMNFASQKGLKDVLAEAKKLKQKLSAPPPKKISPEQQIKMHYADMEYSEAITFYKGLPAADKAKVEIHETYTNSLFKAKRYDSALKEYTTLYTSNQKGIYALRIGDIYTAKGKKNKKMLDKAVSYYLESGLLYKKEGSSNSKVALRKAEFELYNKYDFNKKVKAYEKKLKQNNASSQKNEQDLIKAKRKLRGEKRRLRKEYATMSPPPYELEKIEKLEQKVAILQAGGSVDSSDEGTKLEAERNRIKKEYAQLLAAAKKRLNL